MTTTGSRATRPGMCTYRTGPSAACHPAPLTRGADARVLDYRRLPFHTPMYRFTTVPAVTGVPAAGV
jgi:hypothetical protein